MKNSLHISLTNLKNESRVLKETRSLIENKVFANVYIAGLYEEGLFAEEEYFERIKIKRFELFSRKLSKLFFIQILKYFEFSIRIIYFYFYKKNNISVVNIHSLGLLPIGVLIKYVFKVKLIYDAHELETETNGLHGIRKSISKLIEKLLIKKTDMVIVVSDSISDWYKNAYSCIEPVVVLNAPLRRDFKKNNYFREELNIKPNQIIFLYQGALMSGRGIELIIQTFEKLTDEKNVLILMGYGDLENKIKKASKDSKNIYFYPAVSPDVVLEYTCSADFGISLIENTCLSYYYCLPNKLFEYAMAGLPVLVSNMKEMSKIVSENNMGIVISELSVESINNDINNITDEKIKLMIDNSYRVACENSWEIQSEKMLNAYKKILK